MVALSESHTIASYTEPSPYGWLRSRAPAPTSYAPACEPLYAFREVLKNRTSRTRGEADSCTELVARKFAICIEIWHVELEDCIGHAYFHKYGYVHGDPVNAIDPTGMFWQQLYLQARSAAVAMGAYASVVAQFGARAAGSAFNLLRNLAIESLKPTGFNFLFGTGSFATRFSSTSVTFLGRFVFNTTINLQTLNVLQENLWPVIGSLKLLEQQASNFNGRLAGLPANRVAKYSGQSAEVIQDMLAERDEDVFLSAATTGQIGVIGSSILAARAFSTFTTGISANIAMIEESVPVVYSMLPPNAKARVNARLGIQGGIREFKIDYANPSVIWDAYNGHLKPHQEIDIFRKFLVGVDPSNDVDSEENLVLLVRRMQQKYGVVKVNGAVVRI